MMQANTPSKSTANSAFTSDIVIGLEIHVQLDTESKLFCGCATKPTKKQMQGSQDIPNSRTCEICLGMPGSKPVFNEKVLQYALKLCLALNCAVAPELVFSRKSYFYPDLAKNYQITQYEKPLGSNGFLVLPNGKKVGITRVHIEEDPASLVHPGGNISGASSVLIDYNRSGIPLCEIVTTPTMTSPEEARAFMNKLITILHYLSIFDEKNSVIKADANISIKKSGYIRSEVKNVTGFKEIERALFYEVERQQKAVASGERLILDTRSWDPIKGITMRMRTKESESDYGYILDTDLVAIDVTQDLLTQVTHEMPELADAKIAKYTDQHGISKLDAEVLAQEKKLAELFEKVSIKINPVLAAKWLKRELVRVMNYNKQSFDDLLIDETHMIELLDLVEKKVITDQVAQKILEQLILKPFSPRAYVQKQGLGALSDSKQIEKVCKEAIAENPGVVQEYKKGNEKSFHFLIGQVMRKTQGKATPREVNEIMGKLLK